MSESPLYITGTHRYSFRAGEPAHIMGVCEFTPDGGEPRPCFKVKYRDGFEDYIAIADTSHYKLIGSSGAETELSELHD